MIPAVHEALRLNLGAREQRIPGYRNLDIETHAGVDYVGDAGDLSRFADGSAEEIYASHILEHFPAARTLPVLREWHRVLRPGGILRVAVPDFSVLVELYHRSGLEPYILNALYGDQGYPAAFHYTAFDWQRLRGLLLEAGFSEASQVETFGMSEADCSNQVLTVAGKATCKRVSLNCVAVK